MFMFFIVTSAAEHATVVQSRYRCIDVGSFCCSLFTLDIALIRSERTAAKLEGGYPNQSQ